ncbi:hypothetical protein WH87_01580 [Devosia epidermidihirudinis]|uniref:VWFA domain-containing protein n=1 Tax=Devosia epidermidihirudinis TaxID=1293439 RepID=A0A0F5QIR4_9HYPH|nr:VWA domain-containing protein [Devosia epidermidihirudinis]KKC40887.1 hypothetical protein WH87_01580 [Devosia epidermidihirudinis]
MSDDFNDNPFDQLKGANAPDPRTDARKRAMLAGMAAFEAAQKTEKTTAPTKGYGASGRLSSIISSLKGIKIMDMRIPIGTVAIALLIVPLGYQLYSSTSMTPADTSERAPIVVADAPKPQDEPIPDAAARVPSMVSPAPSSRPSAPTTKAPVSPAPAEPVAAEPAQDASLANQASAPVADAAQMEAAPTIDRLAPPGVDTKRTVNSGAAAFGGASAPARPIALNSTVQTQTVAQPSDQFASFAEQRLKVAATDPVSTFSLDVDTASYAYARRLIEGGEVPAPDAVRIEEMINYFPYDYAPAESAAVPFQPTVAVYPTPWNAKTQLLQIGIKGYIPPAEETKPANLVFLIDTSGSMDSPDKLPLLQRAFGLLVDQLGADDTVSIVAYAGSAGVVLEPTKATEKAKILSALGELKPYGTTAGSEGITLAYRLAEQARVAGGANRVILATDGDFNVGIDDPKALETFIKAKRESGITLSVLGFGRGINDSTMQALAQTGNGNASYISSFREAQKVLVDQVGGTLHTIAKDVKVQVEFNPAVISEYRLIGYETRVLNREDFNNDKVDAGDVGAGTTVTALYEITPVGSGAELVDPLRYGGEAATDTKPGDEIAFLKMRYKQPDSDVSQLIEKAVTPAVVYGDIADVTDDMRFAAAVAAFGQKLRDSDYGGTMSWEQIEALARSGKGADEGGYRAEFISLVRTASLLKPDTATPAN